MARTSFRKKIKVKKEKRVKLEKFPKIYRRLMKLWSAKVRLLWGNRCAVTKVSGEEKILDTHHIESRIMCQVLRYDPLNGILLSKTAHKYGRNSAHQGPVWFFQWLRKHHRPMWRYVLGHRNGKIDLKDREVLYQLEEKLKAEPTSEELAVIARDSE